MIESPHPRSNLRVLLFAIKTYLKFKTSRINDWYLANEKLFFFRGINPLSQKTELQKAMEKRNQHRKELEKMNEVAATKTPFQKMLEERAKRIEDVSPGKYFNEKCRRSLCLVNKFDSFVFCFSWRQVLTARRTTAATLVIALQSRSQSFCECMPRSREDRAHEGSVCEHFSKAFNSICVSAPVRPSHERGWSDLIKTRVALL